MDAYSSRPWVLLRSVIENRGLIKASTIRNLEARYRGSLLGLMWLVVMPTLTLLIYTFVFSVVFKAKFDGGSDSRGEFALLLLAGMIVFNLFSECLNNASGMILNNPNFVKKVVFPIEVIAVVNLLVGLIQAFVWLAIWGLGHVLMVGVPPASALLAPFVILMICPMILGFTWVLGSLGVYLRDIGQIVGVMTMAMLFLSPIFYPISALPSFLQSVLYFNPLTFVIESLRQVLYYGQLPELMPSIIYLSVSSLIGWFGFLWFQKTRRGFADVL